MNAYERRKNFCKKILVDVAHYFILTFTTMAAKKKAAKKTAKKATKKKK